MTSISPRLSRPLKDAVFMEMAEALAQLSTCRRRATACLLIDQDYEVLGQGYNGAPRGEPHCLVTPCPGAGAVSGTELDACEAMHAEWNALQRCRDHGKIWTAFTSTEPCVTCMKMLMNTPCRRVLYVRPYPGADPSRWLRGGREWIQVDLRYQTLIKHRHVLRRKEADCWYLDDASPR